MRYALISDIHANLPALRRAGYGVLTVGKKNTEVTFLRVEYEIDAAVKGIAVSDLPREFGTQLRSDGG